MLRHARSDRERLLAIDKRTQSIVRAPDGVALLSSLLIAPWGIVTVVFLALLGNHAMLDRLAAWRAGEAQS